MSCTTKWMFYKILNVNYLDKTGARHRKPSKIPKIPDFRPDENGKIQQMSRSTCRLIRKKTG